MKPFLRFGLLGLVAAMVLITAAGSLAGAFLLWVASAPDATVRTWMPVITGFSGALSGFVGARAWRKRQVGPDGA